MGLAYSQFFPPPPKFTEKDVPDQKGRVFIVTGGASGVGHELAAMLYHAGGKVYIAGRSEPNARKSIEKINSLKPEISSPGQLEFLYLELDDLTTIKASAEAFKSKESKLDVLFNNAAVSMPPHGSKSKQNVELQMATNCLGPFLFTQLLLPELQVAAQTASPGSVRVVWTSSHPAELSAPKGGFTMADVASPPKSQAKGYNISKIGNWLLASELAREVGSHGILSVVQNPGNLKTNLLRHQSMILRIAVLPLLHDAKFGAYTELYAGLAPELTMEMNGSYVIPWGRVHPGPRKDLVDALRPTQEGGTGLAGEFREWCESQTSQYK